MILSDTEILAAIERGTIVIDPFDITNLGGNSYDVRLAPVLRVYDTVGTRTVLSSWLFGNLMKDWPPERNRLDGGFPPGALDCAREPITRDIPIPDSGLLLVPGILYLASTVEYTESHEHVCNLDGTSSVGRMGISVHKTAGRGDVDFRNHWTCEIDVVQPVRVYAGMPIGQLTYNTVHGQVERKYTAKSGASYTDRDPMPQPSRLWRKLSR